MGLKKLVGVTAGTFDPQKHYQIELTRPVVPPGGAMRMRPKNNPYVVTGAIAASVFDAVKPDAVSEITD